MQENVSHWGSGAPRLLESDASWKNPLAWNTKAIETGERPRVFCGSLMDWADAEAPEGALDRLWKLIGQTPGLDWLLLTKRADRIRECLPDDWGDGYQNVWLGVTVDDRQHGLARLDTLREIPASVRFASVEPLLEDLGEVNLAGIHWMIVGGESGPGARIFRPEWAESLVRQCREQGCAPWVKQLGAHPVYREQELDLPKAGADWEEWPAELATLKVRELPHPGENNEQTHNRRMEALEDGLAKLAEGLTGEEAEQEKALREKYIACERKLFLTRQERAQILHGYHAIYSPRGEWSKFLRAVKMPRRSAYDLMNHPDAPPKKAIKVKQEGPTCAAAAQLSPMAEPEQAETYTPEPVGAEPPELGPRLVETPAKPDYAEEAYQAAIRVIQTAPGIARQALAEQVADRLIRAYKTKNQIA